MARLKNRSSLLNKYSLIFEKNPKSRVFAPLAETYRKLGLIDEALKILKEGIRNHPSYTLGYIVLANCYYDIQSYELAYNTVRPFVANNLENITLQKLFAKTCINLGHLEEALQTFKYLLLLNPQDANVADQIKLLEDDLLVNNEIEEEGFDQSFADFDEDNWVQVDFNKSEENETSQKNDPLDDWSVKKSSPLEEFKEEIKKDSIKVKEHDLDDSYYHQEFDQYSDDVIPAKEVIDELTQKLDPQNNPIITHTLVDLYCDQGHLEKARVILENILELHPKDQASQKKLDEIINLEKIGNAENLLIEPLEPAQVDRFNEEPFKDIKPLFIQEKETDKVDEIKAMFQFFQDGLNNKANERLGKM